MHIDLLGVSSLQAQLKVTQADRVENQKLSDLLTVKDKEITELKHSSNALRQQVQGQCVFIYMHKYYYSVYSCLYLSFYLPLKVI